MDRVAVHINSLLNNCIIIIQTGDAVILCCLQIINEDDTGILVKVKGL